MIQFENPSTKLGDERASIRQIAILLQTLPKRTHRVLLGQLGSDDKQRIAEALLELGEVDAMEQHRVVKRMHDELQAETTSARKVESEIQDEIQIGRARVSKKRSSPIYRSGDSTPDSSGNDDVAAAAAVPFAEKAAHSPGEAGAPIGTSSVGQSCEQSFQTQTDVVSGQAAMSPTPEMLQLMFAQFHQTQAAGVLPTAVIRSVVRPPSGPERSGELAERPRMLPFDTSEQSVSSSPLPSPTDVEAEAAELAERVDQFLTSLSPRELCRALGMATTKQAFLVLCGLPNETAETVLDMLPRRQSRKVRSDMRRMGRLQLSDIDSAKQAVTEIAIQLTQQSQSFAA